LSDNGQRPSRGAAEETIESAKDPIYGPVVASNIDHLMHGGSDNLISSAVDILCRATRYSGKIYRQNIEGYRPEYSYRGASFVSELEDMQRNMTEGVISMLSDKYAMTPAEGQRQVNSANSLLSFAGNDVQRILADANYSLYFSNRTMASGAQLPTTRLNDIVETDTEEQMPHLTRTNLAIGQIVGGIARRNAGRLTVIDNGSGTGATLAAIIGGISDADTDTSQLSITGVESNGDFYASLKEFGVSALTRLRQQNTGFRMEFSDDIYDGMEEETLCLVNDNLADSIAAAKDLPKGPNDVAVVTANYVWHRLTNRAKRGIIDKINEESSNSIFLIADLVENASTVNRRYFDFGNNGPLNCGNIALRQAFENSGFIVRDFAVEGPTGPVHPKLSEKIAAESANDGRLWVAYKGDAAKHALAI
jgi:hypothetical protein